MKKQFLLLSLIGIFTATSLAAEARAQAVPFFDLSPFDGSEELITFDGVGVSPSDDVDRISSVNFNLVDEGTLNDAGQLPRGASAPNTTFAREFAPFDGNFFINFGFDVDLDLRFDNPINTVSAEIRARQTFMQDETLTFELYNGVNFVSSVAVCDRGGGDFFSYGVQSPDLFDRVIIRNRDDQRFSLENLRFGVFEVTTFPLGDCNYDGVVNFFDIQFFIKALTIGYRASADINEDGIVDFLDISPFIDLLSS